MVSARRVVIALGLLLVAVAVLAQAPAVTSLAMARELLQSAATRLQATPEFKDFQTAKALVEQLEKDAKAAPKDEKE